MKEQEVVNKVNNLIADIKRNVDPFVIPSDKIHNAFAKLLEVVKNSSERAVVGPVFRITDFYSISAIRRKGIDGIVDEIDCDRSEIIASLKLFLNSKQDFVAKLKGLYDFTDAKIEEEIKDAINLVVEEIDGEEDSDKEILLCNERKRLETIRKSQEMGKLDAVELLGDFTIDEVVSSEWITEEKLADSVLWYLQSMMSLKRMLDDEEDEEPQPPLPPPPPPPQQQPSQPQSSTKNPKSKGPKNKGSKKR